jgi:hypothetical protein
MALIPFKPGKSGNPGGRPKGDIELRRAARERTAEALATLVTIMRNTKAATAARVSAAEAILNRGWGKPVQPNAFTDVEGNDRPFGRDIEFTDLEKARRIAHILAQGVKSLPPQQAESITNGNSAPNDVAGTRYDEPSKSADESNTYPEEI